MVLSTGWNPAHTLLSMPCLDVFAQGYVLSNLNKGAIWANGKSKVNQRHMAHVLIKPYLKLPLSSEILSCMCQLISLFFLTHLSCFLLLVTKSIKVKKNGLYDPNVTHSLPLCTKYSNWNHLFNYPLYQVLDTQQSTGKKTSSLASWNISIP